MQFLENKLVVYQVALVILTKTNKPYKYAYVKISLKMLNKDIISKLESIYLEIKNTKRNNVEDFISEFIE